LERNTELCEQVGADDEEVDMRIGAVNRFEKSSQRDQTRREQLAELMERLGCRSFDRASFSYYNTWRGLLQKRPEHPKARSAG